MRFVRTTTVGGLVVASGLSLAAALAPSSRAVAATEFHVGAPGVGDPYYHLDGNGGYQVDHYDLRLDYHRSSPVLHGVATIDLTTTEDLSRFDLDLVGLTADEVEVDGVRAGVTQSHHELVVTPAAGLVAGRHATVRVTYHGIPDSARDRKQGGFVAQPDGMYAVGQPHGAATWYPVNDTQRDLATYRLHVTTDADVQVLSNGRRLDRSAAHDNTRTSTYDQPDPTASYLMTLEIGHYRTRQYRSGRFRVLDGVYRPFLQEKQHPEWVLRALAREPEIVRWEQHLYGRFQGDNLGGIAGMPWDDALETQSRPTYGHDEFPNQPSGTSVVVHELAHQWYGDRVTVRDWRDVWLNEGFAEYTELLWAQHEGYGSVQHQIDAIWHGYPRNALFWRKPVFDPGRGALFSNPVYDRGALTVHALRMAVGDRTFFRILRRWPQQHTHQSVSTVEFERFCEHLSGRSLTGMFHRYLSTPRRPPLPTRDGPRHHP